MPIHRNDYTVATPTTLCNQLHASKSVLKVTAQQHFRPCEGRTALWSVNRPDQNSNLLPCQQKLLPANELPWHDRRLSCVHMHETPTPRPSTPPRPQHSSLPYPHTDPSCIRVRHAQLDPVLTEASASPRTDASPCSWRAPPQQCRGQHLPQVGAVRWVWAPSAGSAPTMGAQIWERFATTTASTLHL